jgi:hypothetical protein
MAEQILFVMTKEIGGDPGLRRQYHAVATAHPMCLGETRSTIRVIRVRRDLDHLRNARRMRRFKVRGARFEDCGRDSAAGDAIAARG